MQGVMEDHLSQIPEGMPVKEARDEAFTMVFGEGGHGRMPMIGTHVPLLVAQQYHEEIMQEQLVAANKKAEHTEGFARVTREALRELQESRKANQEWMATMNGEHALLNSFVYLLIPGTMRKGKLMKMMIDCEDDELHLF
ncbi:hypothetical protein L1049_027414 [Liquidambar formosana]|uniref:Uncharacterized protein n=1 Tax=Liquidambar formosana TaxID=63359 RepID=A0AAP0RHC4_LIQFO